MKDHAIAIGRVFLLAALLAETASLFSRISDSRQIAVAGSIRPSFNHNPPISVSSAYPYKRKNLRTGVIERVLGGVWKSRL
jgi:hypothetical protein